MPAPMPDQLHAVNLARLDHEYQLVRNRSAATQELGRSGLRLCVLLNGGALVALFTLLGNLDQPTVDAIGIDRAGLMHAFVFFVVGLISAALAHFFGYFSQNELEADDAMVAADTYAALRDGGPRKITAHRHGLWGQTALYVAMALAAASIAGFCIGCFASLDATGWGPKEPPRSTNSGAARTNPPPAAPAAEVSQGQKP